MINEISNLGYKLHEKRRSWISFLVLDSISVLLLFLLELKVIIFDNTFLNAFFNAILICFLFIAISIPILWRFFYDGLRVKLKNKYQVYINPYYRIRKNKVKDYQLISIYLTSNRIALRLNKNKKKLYMKIAKTRWLLRKKKSLIFKYNLSPFLKFNEFSTPLNFQKQFLNIILALQEWDEKTKRLVN
ncbi:MAG: hypothetical protein ACFE92_10130 [Promethearchaeota archaeon]